MYIKRGIEGNAYYKSTNQTGAEENDRKKQSTHFGPKPAKTGNVFAG
jgi:hypothetical protein